MDRWIYYDSNGQIQRIEQDVNFDGKPDTTVYYESGRPVRQEIASKNDGQIDTWIYLNSKGEVERKGQDTNHAGQPTLWV
jgi:antitoxin component YwqK of YwqJK toxin-antitoxin module